MSVTPVRPGSELACLVSDPLQHLPFYWRPVVPPCSQAVMGRVLHRLRHLDQYRVPERR